MVWVSKRANDYEKEIKVWTERYSDGKIKEKYQYYLLIPYLFNDKKLECKKIRHGWYTSYHPNGKGHSQGTYESGKREGVFSVFSEYGWLLERSLFKGGKLNGESFKRIGDLNIAKGKFSNGVRDGGWIWYHCGLEISGLRMAQGCFNNGVIDGRWTWFWDDGNPRLQGIFDNGTLRKWESWSGGLGGDDDPLSWDDKDDHENSIEILHYWGCSETYLETSPLFKYLGGQINEDSENEDSEIAKDHQTIWQDALDGADPWKMPPIPPPGVLDTS